MAPASPSVAGAHCPGARRSLTHSRALCEHLRCHPPCVYCGGGAPSKVVFHSCDSRCRCCLHLCQELSGIRIRPMNKRNLGVQEPWREVLSFLPRGLLASHVPSRENKGSVQSSPDFLPTEEELWKPLSKFHVIEVRDFPRLSSDHVT